MSKQRVVNRIRKHVHSEHLFESMKPLFTLSFIFGLTPIHVAKISGGVRVLKVSTFGFINATLHVIVYAACYIVTLVRRESVVGYFFRQGDYSEAEDELTNDISNFGDTLQIFNDIIGSSITYFSCIYRRDKLIKMMGVIDAADEAFREIGVKIYYKKLLVFCSIVCCFLFCINLAYMFGIFYRFYQVNIKPSPYLYVTFIDQHFVISIAVGLFLCTSRSIQRRFEIMNRVSFFYIYLLKN